MHTALGRAQGRGPSIRMEGLAETSGRLAEVGCGRPAMGDQLEVLTLVGVLSLSKPVLH